MSLETNFLPPRLYRTSRSQDGLALAPWEVLNRLDRGRWDDSGDEYRVLYCSDSIVGSFIETFADLRQDEAALSALGEVDGQEVEITPDSLIRGRLRNRSTSTLLPGDPQDRVADITGPRSRTCLERALPGFLADQDIGKLKIGNFTGFNRDVSRAASREAYEAGLSGVVSPSAEHDKSKTYAFFEHPPASGRLRAYLIQESSELSINLTAEARTAATYLGILKSVELSDS